MNVSTLRQPGLPELVIGFITYIISITVLVLWIVQTPDTQAALRGIVGAAFNGFAGMASLLIAYAIRIKDFSAFGFKMTSQKWLTLSVILGVVAFGASFIVEGIYFHFITEPNTQGDYEAAAQAGPISLMLLLVTGAILTPLGEEFVFRGVIANALNRYGSFAGIVLSSLIFATVHGASVIFLDAFMVGLIAATLFRKTGSIWPGVVLHCTYNGIHLIYYSTL